MKSQETGIKPQSDIFFYTPSLQAQKMFFYPICLGHFYYEPGYHLARNSYDSFLMMYLLRGECNVVVSGRDYTAVSGQLVFLDCYQPHEYYSSVGWECLWFHFDGPLSREYYQAITSTTGSVMKLPSPYPIENTMQKILKSFVQSNIGLPDSSLSAAQNINEVILSGYISNILSDLLLSVTAINPVSGLSGIINGVTSYINEHPNEDLSLNRLASLANLSPFYFARSFKKITGKTPHDYVLSSRINSAKFYLKTTRLTIEEIGLSLGFPSSSAFCTAFRKLLGITPLKYRDSSAD